jgi:ubiquinone/menaquinone biosynthesis C-methylase UbiE
MDLIKYEHDYDEYIDANRKAWNTAASIHAQRRFKQLLADFVNSDYSALDATALEWMRLIKIRGLAVAQAGCNNGAELLSIKHMGAGRCVGFDISDGFIVQARQLAGASGIPCEFVHTNAYEIPHTYDGQFDLLYISPATLGWMPDLQRFFQVAQRLLKPWGWLLIYEVHPLQDMLAPTADSDQPALRRSYFDGTPILANVGFDYYGCQTDAGPAYWFHHTLTAILHGCLTNGLTIEDFREYPHDPTGRHARLEGQKVQLPLSYVLTARFAGIGA